MPLPVFDTKDAIPEAFRGEYVEREGKWHPNVEDVAGIKASQRRALDEKKALEESLNKALGGRKLEDVQAIIEAQEKAADEAARKKGDFDTILSKREKAIRDELEPQVVEGKAAVAKLAALEFRSQVGDVAIEADINPKKLNAVLKLVDGDHIKRTKDGKFVVVDEDGDPTGETLDKFFTGTFKKLYPEFYLSTGSSGGGSTGGNGERKVAQGTIDGRDDAAFLANIGDIATGKKKVEIA